MLQLQLIINRNSAKLWILLVGFHILSACENGFQINMESEDIPVVYCVLNQNDTVQYVRIARTFLPNDEFHFPSSNQLLYDSTQVNILIQEIETGLSFCDFYPFTIFKDSGTFPNEVHWVYKGIIKVKPNRNYRLLILDPYGDTIASSITNSLDQVQIIDFAYPNLRYIHFQSGDNPTAIWKSTQGAGAYEIGVKFNYLETRDSVSTKYQIDIPLSLTFYNNAIPTIYEKELNSNLFYRGISTMINPDEKVVREVIDVDFYIMNAGEQLANYMMYNNLREEHSGKPYTNIENGIGIFSCFNVSTNESFKLTRQTIDSIAFGSQTNDLSFVASNDPLTR